MDARLILRTAPVAALLLAATTSPALANSISDVKFNEFETETGLQPIFRSRAAVEVTLAEPVAMAVDGCAPEELAPIGVSRITMTRTDPPHQDSEPVDFPEGRIAPQQPCSTQKLFIPMRFDPTEATFTVVVVLADGTTLTKEGVTFKGAPRGNPSSVFSFDADLLQGDKDGKLGIAATAEVKLDILTGPIAKLSAASLRFEGETATSGDSRAFKEALKLESNFVWRVRGVGEYFAIVAKPLFLEADDNLRTINYKGSLGFATEVPLTQDLGALLQDALGRCTYKSGNCSQWGMTAGVSYGFNSKWKRQAGRFDRSDDTVTIAEAVWDLPLNNKLGLFAKYSWQSDSPDGSSSESYEISATFKPWGCEKVGLKLSYIDGEFLPGQQRRDAIRFGVSSLLGAATGRGGC